MAVKRKFTCKMSTLLYDGDLIVTAAEGQSTFASKRLRTGLVTESRTLVGELGGKDSSAQAQEAVTGELTQQQNNSITEMLDLFGKLKDSARKAFAGDHVKLREAYQVGINTPSDLASILGRAKKARDAAQTAADATALKDKGGWISDDTTALDTAIDDVSDLDKQQQASVIVQIGGTDARNTAANTLYENLLTIQNAADIEWPARVESNRATRESFRLGVFPPSGHGKKEAPPTTPAKPSP